jgi:hypothetical protein
MKFGPIDLKGTPLGTYRELTPAEVKLLMKAAGHEEKRPKPKPQAKSPIKEVTAAQKPKNRTVLNTERSSRRPK